MTNFGVTLTENSKKKSEEVESKDSACENILDKIENSSVKFDFEGQKLFLSIPQIMFKNNVRGFIPPEKWDNGINAFLLNYNFTGRNSKNFKDNVDNNNYF